MQKKIIYLAVSALASSAAFAQTNVTVYGVADASFEQYNASGGNGIEIRGGAQNSVVARNRIASNASYIGFKGVEDLGNGLKAVFQFENELDITGQTGNTRANNLATRDTYVGLTGGFGTVIGGWISSPHRSTAAKFDLMPGAAGTGSSLSIIGRVNVGSVFQPMVNGVSTQTFGTQTAAGSAGTATQANNIGVIARHSAVAYVSPTFAGFSGVVAYIGNETRDNTDGLGAGYAERSPKAWNAALNYDNGPLSVSYSYLAIRDFGASIAANTAAAYDLSGQEKHRAHLLAAKYRFASGTTISAMYDRVNAEVLDGPALGNGDVTLKRNNFYLAAKQEIGNYDITFAWARAGDNTIDVGGRNLGAGRDATTDTGANMYSLRLANNLSKRTQLYAQYTQLRNDRNATYDLGVGSTNVTGTGAGATFAGADIKSLGLGLRHTF